MLFAQKLNISPHVQFLSLGFTPTISQLVRLIFAFSATFLFQFAFIKLLGGVLLLWIVNELRQDLFTVQKIKSPTKQSKEPSFMSGVYKVLIADITLSFDNVLGVAGAAKEHYMLLFFGLALSVVLIGAAATYFAKYIQDHKWVGYVGLAVILLVTVQLIIGSLIDYGVLTINEPFFAGHFPSQSIMPAVLILESMAQAGAFLVLNNVPEPLKKNMLFSSITDSKFRAPIVPGDQVKIKMQLAKIRLGAVKLIGKAFVDDKLVAEANLMANIVNRAGS